MDERVFSMHSKMCKYERNTPGQDSSVLLPNDFNLEGDMLGENPSCTRFAHGLAHRFDWPWTRRLCQQQWRAPNHLFTLSHKPHLSKAFRFKNNVLPSGDPPAIKSARTVNVVSDILLRVILKSPLKSLSVVTVGHETPSFGFGSRRT